MSRSHVALFVAWLSMPGVAPSAGQTPVPCGGEVYRGFDSRMSGELLASIPAATADFVGLEVDNRHVFLASGNVVFMIDAQGKVTTTHVDEPLQAIAVDRQGHLLLQSRQTLRILPRPPGKPFSVPGASITGPVFGSGADSFLEARPDAGGRTRLVVHRSSDFAPTPLAVLKGVRGPIAWTDTGLVAVVDDGVVALNRQESKLVAVDRDRAFARATGIAALPSGRVLVALDRALMVTSGTSRLVVAAFHAAVRPSESGLVVFDREKGFLWRVAGVEKVGDAADDARHAEALLSEWRKSRDRQAGLEAARILGCRVLAN